MLWEWSIKDKAVVVLLKVSTHIHMKAWFCNVFSHSKSSKVERSSYLNESKIKGYPNEI